MIGVDRELGTFVSQAQLPDRKDSAASYNSGLQIYQDQNSYDAGNGGSGSFVGQLYQEGPTDMIDNDYMGDPAGDGEIIVDYQEDDALEGQFAATGDQDQDNQFDNLEVNGNI